MQVFLCGSGAVNHQIAQALHGFLGDVIQDLEPFLSSESVRKGTAVFFCALYTTLTLAI